MKPETAPGEKSWYLVYTKPRQEGVAFANLTRQGYAAYLPRCRRTRKHRGRSTPAIEPLFPRYLFIHLDSRTDNWGPIRSTLGVTSLVRFGPAPAPVPESLVDFLRSREGADGLHPGLGGPGYRAGDRVRVAAGPLAGYEGILQARTGRDRVVVLLEILGNQVRTQLERDQLEHNS